MYLLRGATVVPARSKKRVYNAVQGWNRLIQSPPKPCFDVSVSPTNVSSTEISMDWRSASISTRPWGYGSTWRPVTPYDVGSYYLQVTPIHSVTTATPSGHCLNVPFQADRLHVMQSGYLESFTIPGPLAPPTDTDNVAKARVLAKIVSEETTDLALAFAERQQTANLLGTTASRVARSARKLKSLLSPRSWKLFLGKPARGSALRGTALYRRNERRKTQKYFDRNGRNVSRHVLEVQYGWKPLLQDVESSLHVIERRQIDNEFRFSKRSRVVTHRREFVPLPAASEGYFSYSRTKTWTVRYKIWYELRTDLLGTLAAAGLTNLASVAWDRVPFSFVIDWFFTAGQWLRNFGIDNVVNFLDGSRGVSISVSDVTSSPAVADPWAYTVASGGQVTNIYTQYTRTKLFSFPSNKPYWKNPVSLTHMLNGLALIGALLGGYNARASRL